MLNVVYKLTVSLLITLAFVV